MLHGDEVEVIVIQLDCKPNEKYTNGKQCCKGDERQETIFLPERDLSTNQVNRRHESA